MLMQIADDFIDNVVTASCLVAKHRKSNTVEVKDVQLHLGEFIVLVYLYVLQLTLFGDETKYSFYFIRYINMYQHIETRT